MKPCTRDEVYAASLEYFRGDDLAAETFFKYSLQDKEGHFYEKTPDEMHKRLAKEFARMEKKFGGKQALSEKYIFELLDQFKYIVPQGSPMMGVGNDFQQVSLSNCVVVDSPEDDMSSIMNTARDLANLFKRRCGVGLDISRLRPDGAAVNNSAKTSTGAWSFAELYSFVTKMVGQNNRRGALMISIDVRHPDIEKFAIMKRDKTKVTGANVSIRLTGDFMKAALNDEEYTLRWPCDVPVEEAKITKVVKAKEIWDIIVESATGYAEPGLLMWDNILKYLPAHCYPEFFTICVNPCVTGDTWINTEGGARQVSSLIDKPFVAIVNGEKYKATGFWKTGDKEVFSVNTDRGYNLKATTDHRIKTPSGWCEVGNLKVGDEVVLSDNDNVWWGEGSLAEGWVVGQVLGDGCFNPEKYPGQMAFWGEHRDHMSQRAEKYVNFALAHLLDRGKISRRSQEQGKKFVVASTAIDKLCEKYLKPGTKEILPAVEEDSLPFYTGFLRGLFDADGSVQGNLEKGVSIRLTQANLKTLIVAQRMLARLGIVSTIYKGRKPAGAKLLPDGKGSLKEYNCKELHELVISRDMMQKFDSSIGFEEPAKSDKLNEISIRRNRSPYKTHFVAKVTSVEAVGIEPVYDCTVEEVHQFDANGILAHNCGEICLSAFDSCRLISQNLKWYVKEPFTKKAEFDWQLFVKHTEDAMRLSDDLVELELEKLGELVKSSIGDEKELYEKLYWACDRGRRTGLGTHGLADAVARMGVAYDSDEAIEFIEKIYKVRKEAAYGESIALAEQRGAFPAYDAELEKGHPFLESLGEDILLDMSQWGRRNISILTNAPTGSVSIVSQTSSGIEPVFRNDYTRRKKKNHDELPEETDYVDDEGTHWREFDVSHHNVNEWRELAKEDKLPDFFVESDTIDWERRIDIQAAIQRHVDHSISSTINLPKGTSEEVVGKLYMKAWENDLKGVTVYVDGCRSGVLVTDEDGTRFEYTNAPKRPDELECDIHHTSVKGVEWLIFVGLMDGKPYEVFGGLAEAIEIPKDYKKGRVIKTSSFKHAPNRYDLKVNGFTIKNIVKQFDNPTYQVHTRLTSMALRHGIRPSFLVEQLLKDPDNHLASFSKVLSRVIKRYIIDGEAVTSEKLCEQCKSEGLIYQEGCVTCTDCGYAKCG